MPNVGAIILAAGGSRRFGQPKQLLPFQSESLVRRSVRVATEAGIMSIVVVAGESIEAIKAEVRETSAAVVENRDWQLGLGTSIRHGLQHLRALVPDLKAVVITACDQPFVEASTIAALLGEWKRSGKPIVASSYAGTVGIPALFDRSCFEALLALPDDSGAKALIESRQDEVAQLKFEQGAIDIDTPADFERLTR
jgi:molybdenum cofactor cytidylyltransferase